ncbi:beta/alpha barrel domain-containing protein [Bacillus velezensis]|uniref:hypothetical protein n=1 Tax=Bacillus velezensis TaxID=492670 RepID=UPI0011A32703|nr:hypothetical protein [Bacillus velezensis]
MKGDREKGDILEVIKEGKEYKLGWVCVKASWVKVGGEEVKGSGVDVWRVMGFGVGGRRWERKGFERKDGM